VDKIVKYGLIVVRDGKFLINRKYNTKLFLMPGGKPKLGEKIEDCLVREIKEEHQVDLITNSIKFFGDFEDMAANEPDTIISMKVFVGNINGMPQVNREIEEQRWFGKEDNSEILSPIIKNKILPAIINKQVI